MSGGTMSFLSATVLLFLVLDPLGNIPVFLSVLNRVPVEKRKKVVLRESVIAFGVLLFFFVFGDNIMNLLGIDQPSLGIAGGVILFLIALKMIFPGMQIEYSDQKSEPLIVPLAVPLIAGPSAIATVILFMAGAPGRPWEVFFSIACAWAASTVILFLGTSFHKIFGERGLVALERLMGMILATISVQMLMNGISNFLKMNI